MCLMLRTCMCRAGHTCGSQQGAASSVISRWPTADSLGVSVCVCVCVCVCTPGRTTARTNSVQTSAWQAAAAGRGRKCRAVPNNQVGSFRLEPDANCSASQNESCLAAGELLKTHQLHFECSARRATSAVPSKRCLMVTLS